MRKIIVGAFLTLDGVVQAAGGAEDGFSHGGWSAPYYDAVLDQLAEKQKRPAKELLLGRKTYEIFSSFFPDHADIWPGVNEVTKYVMSTTLDRAKWNNSVILRGVDDIIKLKHTAGSDLQVHGSGTLVQTLLRHDLVDELWLMIHPVTLGTGLKLFADGTIPAAFRLVESTTTPSGVIVANYQRAGEIKTGTMGGSDGDGASATGSDLDSRLRGFCQDYARAVWEKDVNGFLALYHPGARVFDTWGTWSHEGEQARRKVVEQWFGSLGNERVAVTFDRVQTTVTGSQGLLSARVVFAATSPAGVELRSMQNRLTWVLAPEGGTWKIIHEHTSVPLGPDLKGLLARE